MDDTLFDVGPTQATVWPERPRYLLSYAYVSSMDTALCADLGVDLIVDSGAFTVAASGKQMDHDAYLDWLLEHQDLISFALSLDVIGDAWESAVNHDYAANKLGDAVTLVPTFHLGSSMTELERLCRMYDLISIGGAVPYAKQKNHLATVLTQMHRVAAEHGTKVHGLGMTGNRIIHGFPWYSVDSSGWTAPTRFPVLPLAVREGRIVQLEHGWTMDRTDRALVTQYGLDPDMVSTPGWSLKEHVGPELALERREDVMRASARAYMYAEAYKNTTQPDAPIRIYLSGNTGGLEGGAIGVIARAHGMGTPWPLTTPQEGITS